MLPSQMSHSSNLIQILKQDIFQKLYMGTKPYSSTPERL